MKNYKSYGAVVAAIVLALQVHAYTIPWSGKGAHQFHAGQDNLYITNASAYTTLLNSMQSIGLTSTTLNVDMSACCGVVNRFALG